MKRFGGFRIERFIECQAWPSGCVHQCVRHHSYGVQLCAMDARCQQHSLLLSVACSLSRLTNNLAVALPRSKPLSQVVTIKCVVLHGC
jgi:hypothetical protein